MKKENKLRYTVNVVLMIVIAILSVLGLKQLLEFEKAFDYKMNPVFAGLSCILCGFYILLAFYRLLRNSTNEDKKIRIINTLNSNMWFVYLLLLGLAYIQNAEFIGLYDTVASASGHINFELALMLVSLIGIILQLVFLVLSKMNAKISD